MSETGSETEFFSIRKKNFAELMRSILVLYGRHLLENTQDPLYVVSLGCGMGMEALSFIEDSGFRDRVRYLGLDIDEFNLTNGALSLLERYPQVAANFQAKAFDLRTGEAYPTPEHFPQKPNIILVRSPNLLSAQQTWSKALQDTRNNIAENGIVIIITDDEDYWNAFARQTKIEEVLQDSCDIFKAKKHDLLDPSFEPTSTHPESHIVILKLKLSRN